MTYRTGLIVIVAVDAALLVLGASVVACVGLLVELALIRLLLVRWYGPWWERRYGEGRDAEGLR